MALPASDNFAAANNTILTTYSGSWTFNAGEFRINTNAVYSSGGGADDQAAHWNADVFDDDQYAEATVAAITGGTYTGVAVRCAASGASFYAFLGDATDGSYLDKYVSGVYTQLGSKGSPFAVSDVIRLEVSGTTLTPKINGSTSGTPGAQTDSALSSGSAGIGGAGSSSSSRIDNWEGGNLGAAGITATLAKTLQGATLSAAGALALSGSLTKTLASATLSASAGAGSASTGSLSATLQAATVTGAGTLPIAATLAKTLAAATLGGQGFILTNASVNGVLSVSSNGRYFENNDGPVVLAGMHTWYIPQNGGDSDPPPATDWAEFLAALVDYGHTATKLWRMETARDWSDASGQYFAPLPYVRTGPGNAADGKLKFDLDSWNSAYFELVRTRAIELGNAGIYAIVQLFQGWQIADKGIGPGDPWTYHPFDDANNINSVNGDPNSDGSGYEMRDTSQTALYNRSKAFVARLIDELNDLDNILWEVCNEDTQSTAAVAWQRGIAAYIKSVEAGKAKQHPIGITKLYPGGSNTDLFGSTDADWISIDDNEAGPDAADGSKVILWDTDHVSGLTSDYQWVMRSFAQGNNPLYMDEWDGALYGTDRRATSGYILIRRLLGDAAAYSRRMDLANTTPQGSLSSTGWCLAKTTGMAHLFAYQDGTGAFDVTLTGISGTFKVEWFRVSTGETTAGSDVSGGAVRTLTPPWSGAVAAFLQQANTGSLTKTLASASLSASGQVAVVGALAVTLQAASLAVAGNGPGISATLSATLSAATLAASGQVAISGQGSLSLGAASLAASAQLALLGAVAVTLQAAALSASGQLALLGQANVTLAAATLMATGAQGAVNSGNASLALVNATLAADGQLAIDGQVGGTLQGATLAANATLAIVAATSLTLTDATLAAAGSLASGPNGSVGVTLAAASLVAAGQLSISAAAAMALSPATLSSLGTLVIMGAVTATLANASLAASEQPVVIASISGFVFGVNPIGTVRG